MGRLILVSNRLPVTVRRRRAGGPELIRSSGGLVSALDPVHRRGDGVWIGNLGDEPDQATREALADRRFIAVSVTAAEMRGYYQGFANSALWPLFHYLPERCRFSASQFETYRAVNARFADCVVQNATSDDRIWIHDYQLMLVPGMVRSRLPDARIGFFLHIPFPSSEVFRLLPQREEILRGLLGADVIGLHTYDYARHLVSSLLRVLGTRTREGFAEVAGRQVQIATHPIGIDVESMVAVTHSRAAENRIADLSAMLAGRRMILGVERLDYTKGIPLKMMAFRRLLQSSPRWRANVVYIQIVVPSREDIQSYRDQRREVEEMVGRINGEFGQPGRVPIHYVHRSIPQTELAALYRTADVGFVVPIRDGMNLVAKEFVASQQEGHGVLVLSEFAGAASELGEAIRVNPWDIDATARALEEALEMAPDERRRRMAAMFRRINANDVQAWVRRSLRSLEPKATPRSNIPAPREPLELAAEIRSSLEDASSPVFLLDYDGTLREFTVHPEDAIPTPAILGLLADLAGLPGACVVVVSGRGRETLSRWFGDLPITLVAEHGVWLRAGPGDAWRETASIGETAWKADVRPVLEQYAQRTPGASVEEKAAALVWHYRAADDDLARWQARELTAHLGEYLANEPVEVIEGARIVEVRQQGVNKGTAYRFVNEALGPFDFKLAIGDDTTDEDLFAAVGDDGFTVRVGEGASRARVSISSPSTARELLRALIPPRAV